MPGELWRIDMLGGLRVSRGECLIEHFPTRKAASLLAWLAYHPQQPHARDRLLAEFWPDSDTQDARNSLRQTLHLLRSLMETQGSTLPLFQSDRTTLQLNPAAFETDIARFDAHLKAVKASHGTDEALEQAMQAVDLYRGDLLAGYYDEWIVPERQRVEAAYRQTLHEIVRALEAVNEPLRAVPYALRLVAADPLEEQAHCLAIRLYAASGQTAKAAAQYRELEQLLREEFGNEPSRTTQEIVQTTLSSHRVVAQPPVAFAASVRISEGHQSSLPQFIESAPPFEEAPQSSIIPNLFIPLTRLFGREVEIAELTRLLRDPKTRLLTLTAVSSAPRRFRSGRRIATAALCLVPLLAFLIPYLVPNQRPTTFQPTPPGMARVLPAEEIEAKLLLVEAIQDRTDSQETPQENRARQSRRLALCNELTEQAWNAWYGSEEEDWLMRLERIHSDLNAALRWAVDNDPPKAMQMAGTLTRFWYVENLIPEGHLWLQAALRSNPPLHTNVRARVVVGEAWLTDEDGNYVKARELCQEALAIYQETRDRWGIAHAMRILGLTYGGQLDGNRAIPCLQEAYRRFEEVGDHRGMALAQLCIAFDCNNWDSRHTSPRQYDEKKFESMSRSHELFQEIGNDWGIGLTLKSMAEYADALGKHSDAHRLRAEYLSFTRQCESARSERLWDLYSRTRARQDWKTVRRSLTLLGEISTSQSAAYPQLRLLDRFIDYYVQGEVKPEKATELLGAVQAASPTLHIDEFNRSLKASSSTLDADLGDIRFRNALSTGRSMSPAQAVALAISP